MKRQPAALRSIEAITLFVSALLSVPGCAKKPVTSGQYSVKDNYFRKLIAGTA